MNGVWAMAARGKRWLALGVLAVAACLPRPAAAQVTVTILGDSALAHIELAGLPISYVIDFTLEFQQPQNLTTSCLGIGATIVNPLDPAFLARLEDVSLLNLPAALPILITVGAPAPCGLAFKNEAQVELHTANLLFLPTLFRLYKAPPGGTFRDITNGVFAGSIRTRGSTGGFSDFLVLLDLSSNNVKAVKHYSFLTTRAAGASLSPAARRALDLLLSQSRAAFNAGDFAGARTFAQQYESRARQFAGAGIPNQWRSARDLDNPAGDLIGTAQALQFVLGQLAGL